MGRRKSGRAVIPVIPYVQGPNFPTPDPAVTAVERFVAWTRRPRRIGRQKNRERGGDPGRPPASSAPSSPAAKRPRLPPPICPGPASREGSQPRHSQPRHRSEQAAIGPCNPLHAGGMQKKPLVHAVFWRSILLHAGGMQNKSLVHAVFWRSLLLHAGGMQGRGWSFSFGGVVGDLSHLLH